MNTIIAPTGRAALGDDRLPERFWAKVKVSDRGCWEWTAQIGDKGYARFQLDGRPYRAHRLAYETLTAPVPGELVLDHLCRVRHCVNPAHLEPVTNRENLRRGEHRESRKTHCAQGHPFEGENLRISKNGQRMCRTCRRKWGRESMAAKRAAAKGGAA